MRWTKAALWPEPMSLDAPVSRAEDAPVLSELLPCAGPSPEELAVESSRARFAHALVATLPVRERSVLTLRFGMAWPHREWSLQLVGSLCALSRERIRQIETNALRRLRGELPAREFPGIAARWTPPPDVTDRLAAIEDALAGDLDPVTRRVFVQERGRLRAGLAGPRAHGWGPS